MQRSWGGRAPPAGCLATRSPRVCRSGRPEGRGRAAVAPEQPWYGLLRQYLRSQGHRFRCRDRGRRRRRRTQRPAPQAPRLRQADRTARRPAVAMTARIRRSPVGTPLPLSDGLGRPEQRVAQIRRPADGRERCRLLRPGQVRAKQRHPRPLRRLAAQRGWPHVWFAGRPAPPGPVPRAGRRRGRARQRPCGRRAALPRRRG